MFEFDRKMCESCTKYEQKMFSLSIILTKHAFYEEFFSIFVVFCGWLSKLIFFLKSKLLKMVLCLIFGGCCDGCCVDDSRRHPTHSYHMPSPCQLNLRYQSLFIFKIPQCNSIIFTARSFFYFHLLSTQSDVVDDELTHDGHRRRREL